ncbi:DUF4194 domain-containing protein [Kribbella sp. NPDC006257]|uniref:DUF4194 domain-containing protein n=1 Tax=Kribbella sp. NPDC006257 TaxID=3156738 RepID=UPI0033B68B79
MITNLMNRRVLLGRSDPGLWETFVDNEIAVTRHFHNMYIDLTVDRGAQVVLKRQVYPDGVDYRVLLREQRATRELSTAMLYLRSEYNRQTHSGAERVQVSRSDLVAEIEAFWPDDETNRKARTGNVNAAIRGLVEQDLLIGGKEADDWEVSPAIQVLFSAEAISRLADWLTEPDRAPGTDQAEVDDDQEDS